MAVTEQYNNDALLLSQDQQSLVAAVSYKTLPASPSVTGTVNSVTGNGFAGIFLASARSLGQRNFSALVCNSQGAVKVFHGVIDDPTTGGATIVSATEVSVPNGGLGTFPNNMSYTGTSFNYTYSGTQIGSVTDTYVSSPVVGGAILFRVDPSNSVNTAEISFFRTLSGSITYPDTSPVTVQVVPDIDDGASAALTSSYEPRIHSIIGAPFGDLEFDIGKSAPWTRYMSDDVFITDINMGDPRYYVVDWTKTVRGSKFTSLGIDYFQDPVGWRKAQVLAASKAWGYQQDDWILFVDASEIMSCDTRDEPDNVSISPFKSYVHREIERAVSLGNDSVCLPFYAFVRNASTLDGRWAIQIADPQQVADQLLASGSSLTVEEVNTASIQVATPYYYQRQLTATGSGLVRLIKVSALLTTLGTIKESFDWASIDTLGEPSEDVKTQIISYAYAKWVNPATLQDDGLKMRQRMSLVRPLTGLPSNGIGDASGTAGPYKVAVDGAVVDEPGTGTSAGLYTPMYYSLFRINPQDGVWYRSGVYAPEPIIANSFVYTFTSEGTAYNALVQT